MNPGAAVLAEIRLGAVLLAQPLALLLLIPFALLLWLMWRRRGARAVLGSSEGSWMRTLPGSLRARAQGLPMVLQLAALAVMIVALARPQTEDPELQEVEGIDLMIALDLSGSMYAVDLSAEEIIAWQRAHGTEPPNRIEIARDVLRGFVERRERDRVGLVVFAREAYVQFPLTLDYGAMLAMIDQLEIGMIDASATAIGNAIGLSLRGLLESTAETRAIILITDGKQHGGNVEPRDAARLAADEGIRIFPILIGEDGPTMMPSRRPSPGGRPMTYHPEVHPIDPDLLDELAEMTGGAWSGATKEEDLSRDLEAILETLERTRMQDIARASRRDHFHPLLVLALLLMAAAFGLRFRWLRRYP